MECFFFPSWLLRVSLSVAFTSMLCVRNVYEDNVMRKSKLHKYCFYTLNYIVVICYNVCNKVFGRGIVNSADFRSNVFRSVLFECKMSKHIGNKKLGKIKQ